MRFGMLSTNPIIDCGLLAWFLAQLIKVMLDLVLLGRLDVRRFFSSGGMPSSHSALVVACTAAIGKLTGVQGPLFALAVILSAVVMYDACNVRRSAGDTARLVNKLLEHMEQLTAEDLADNLKEVMGHTPLQVLMGALLGLGVGLLV
ncbi:MAG: divergent PAP2 family protein [Oscillospiraceae bacterium]|jgi:acid phosphatase family membrane protein YuiD|nr:divergent PAP2 family protein [Oscillospiraceae bacterium]MCI8715344.1 divergent PAP2 family protein [Oscillospiraceae bacterium]MCI9317014.1 divergent PAP2 family protein [Oscillospiraceae bacterium]MDE6934250.1 divergent PAP2 family protein [Oscillospiraceae bacterium]